MFLCFPHLCVHHTSKSFVLIRVVSHKVVKVSHYLASSCSLLRVIPSEQPQLQYSYVSYSVLYLFSISVLHSSHMALLPHHIAMGSTVSSELLHISHIQRSSGTVVLLSITTQ